MVRMMVLDDEETCSLLEGSFVAEFDNEEDAQDFADGTIISFVKTDKTVEVPVYKAVFDK